MKTRHILAITVLAIGALASAVQDSAVAKAAIQKQMDGYSAALKAKDLKALEKFVLANFSADFKDTDTQGKVRNRQQTIDSMKQNVAMLKTVHSIKITITEIKVNGNKATTTEKLALDATIAGMSPEAKTSKLNVDSTWAGTYVKKGNTWWCVSSKGLKEKVMIDGKEVGG